MAKPEERKEPPAFIDYEGDSASEVPREYTYTQLYDHWKRQTLKTHNASSYLWTIKDRKLLTRLRQEFTPEQIAKMMTWWISHKPLEEASKLSWFYTHRYEVHEHINETKDYGW